MGQGSATEKMDWLIVGAGLYGAVFACEKAKQGQRVCVIDKRNEVAGNIYTKKIHGIVVHQYGPHIFHTNDEEVWNYVKRLASFNSYINSPIALYGDEMYNLPFNMNTFNKMWGVVTPGQAKEKIQSEIKKEGIEEPQNLEEQALSLVGRDIYEKLIRGYTQKQWGKPCNELPSFIIRRIPLRFVYDNNYFNDRFEGIPEGGYTNMVEKILSGIPVETKRDYATSVKRVDDGFIMDGIHFDHLLYTGMIDEFYDYCFGALQYRSLRFETEWLSDVSSFQGNAVVNYTSEQVPFTRIIEHKYFEFGRDPRTGKEIPGTIITREYPEGWEKGKEPYYPVNDDSNMALYEKYNSLAAKDERVQFGGRLGLYRYLNMDQVIRMALDAARKPETAE